jgi:hypothetical protein
MHAHRKRRRLAVLALAIVAGIIIWRGIQTPGSPPISLRYVGERRSGPTFAITNQTAKFQHVGWNMEVWNGTNWHWDESISHYHKIVLAPNTGAYITAVFSWDTPINKWRLVASTDEPLTGPDSDVAAVKYWWRFSRNSPVKTPIRGIFSTNTTYFGNRHVFTSEEILEPKATSEISGDDGPN